MDFFVCRGFYEVIHLADVFVLGAADFSLACRFFAGHNCQTDVLVQESADYFFCLPALFCECIRQASVHLIIYTGENELSSLGPSFPHTLSALTRPLSTLTRPFLLSYYPSSALTNPLAFALHHYPLASSSLFLLPCFSVIISLSTHLFSASPLLLFAVSPLCAFSANSLWSAQTLALRSSLLFAVFPLCAFRPLHLCAYSAFPPLYPTSPLSPFSGLPCPSLAPLGSFSGLFLSLFLSAYMASYAPPSSPPQPSFTGRDYGSSNLGFRISE